MRKIHIYLLIILIVFISCKHESKLNRTYSNDEIGWSIKIPSDWEIIDESDIRKYTETGKNAIEELMEEKIDYSGLKNLIGLKKDNFNIFNATIEPFTSSKPSDWDTNDYFLKEVIYQSYINQGIRVDSSTSSIEMIDGVNFKTYTFTCYTPEDSVFIKQTLYGCLINGFDFGVTLSYNNDKDKNEMLTILRGSKFSKINKNQ